MGMSVNLKPFVITILLVFLNSRILPVRLLKTFVFILVAFLIIEYVVAYTQVIPTFHLAYMRIDFDGLPGLIRPVGLFLDFHLTSFTIVFSLFILGYPKLAGIISIFFGSFQIVLGWFIIALEKINLVNILISFLIISFALFTVGHFRVGENSQSMTTVLLNILDYEVNYQCLILGCSVNFDTLNLSSGIGNTDTVNDFGYYRVLYQFGLLWVILLLFSLRKYNKWFIAANIIMCIHYPITLGVLGFIIFIYLLHCMKYREYIDANKSRSVRDLEF